MKMKIYLFTLVILGLAFSGAQPVGEVLWVDDDPRCQGHTPCFSSIQEAVEAASFGATINVLQGTYEENVLITKSLTLYAQSKEVILIAENSNTSLLEIVEVSSVWIKGFTFQGTKDAGVSIRQSSHIHLINNSIISARIGIEVENSRDTTLIGNFITQNNITGISIADSDMIVIQDNIIVENGGPHIDSAGIWLIQVGQAVLQGNHIEANNNTRGPGGRGISILYVSQPPEFIGGTELLLENNVIQGHKGCGVWANGFVCVQGANNYIQGNHPDLCGEVDAEVRLSPVLLSEQDVIKVPDDYASLQDGLDAVPSGGTVLITSGTYQESVTIPKPLTLRGEGRVILQALLTSFIALSVPASVQGVRIESLIIEGGIQINGEDVVLQDNQLRGRPSFFDKIFLGRSASSHFSHNEIENLPIDATDSHLLEITDNTIVGGAITVGGLIQTEGIIQGNHLEGSSIHLTGSLQRRGYWTIAENKMESGFALIIQGPMDIAIVDNVIKGFQGDGLTLRSSGQGEIVAEISRNRITSNEGYGIKLEYACEVGNPFYGRISGTDNEIHDNAKGDLCPEDYPWPEGFVREEG